MEYELQLSLKDWTSNPLSKPETMQVMVSSDIPQSWIFFTLTTNFRVDVKSPDTLGISPDTGNIEIRNTHLHSTIPSCLRELNLLVDIVGELLSSHLPPHLQAALFIPSSILIPYESTPHSTTSRHPSIFCTKHLNIVVPTFSLVLDYDKLNNLIPNSKPLVVEKGLIHTGSPEYLWNLSDPSKGYFPGHRRLHVRLPYDYEGYEKLSEGLTLQDFESSKSLLLGHTSKYLLRGKRPWRRLNPLV